MKSFLLLSFTIIFSFNTYCQAQENARYLGGQLYLHSQSDFFEENNNSQLIFKGFSFSISPQIGKFISPTSAIGITTGYIYSFNKSLNDNSIDPVDEYIKTTRQHFSLSPFFRKLIFLRDKLYLDTHIEATGQLGFSKNNISNTKEDENPILRMEISPGISYFLSEKWIIGVRLGRIYYEKEFKTSEGNYNRHIYGMNFISNSLSLRFQYLLSSNKIE